MNRPWIVIAVLVAVMFSVPIAVVLDLRLMATNDELAQFLVGDTSGIVRKLARRETEHRLARKLINPKEFVRLGFGYSAIFGRGRLENCQNLTWVVEVARRQGVPTFSDVDLSVLIPRAIDDGDECAIELLVKDGADFSKRDIAGETSLQRASRFAAVPSSHCPDCYARVVQMLRTESEGRANTSLNSQR